jgi:hypothetical protein
MFDYQIKQIIITLSFTAKAMNLKVNTFLIGPPRCASTSLMALLAQHSEVCCSQPKEPTFFCSDLPAGYDNEPTTIAEYHLKFFPHFNPEKHKIICDGTPIYITSEAAIPDILKYNPDAKFIGLVRNPIDLVVSFHAARVRVGLRHENILDFEEAWSAQNDRLEGRLLPNSVIRRDLLQYGKMGALGTQYERLLKLVSPENLHVIHFEDLKSNYTFVVKNLFEFLELDFIENFQYEHRESAASWKNEIVRSLHHYSKKLANAMPFTPQIGITRIIKRLGIQQNKKTEISPEFRADLFEYFKSEIELLEVVLGRDYSHWK